MKIVRIRNDSHSQMERRKIPQLLGNSEIDVLNIAILFETIIFSASIPLHVYSSQIEWRCLNVFFFLTFVRHYLFYIRKIIPISYSYKNILCQQTRVWTDFPVFFFHSYETFVVR